MNRHAFFACIPLVVAVACADSESRPPLSEPGIDRADGGPTFDLPEGGSKMCAVNESNGNPDVDTDGDGYRLREDCNECDPLINRGAFDVAQSGIDEDCDGHVDNAPLVCDEGLPIDPTDPLDAVKALGLCKRAEGQSDWGVLSARYLRPDRTFATPNLDVGILPSFGVNAPQAGRSMLALSTGYARSPADPGYQSGTSRTKSLIHGAPPGYGNRPFAGCPPVDTGNPHDGIGLEIVIRVPTNAKSLRYQQNFFTYEYPFFICTRWNDFYVAIMDPQPPRLVDGNIAFDSLGNPLSVNSGLLQVCTPGTHGGKTFDCPLGTASLAQTGYEKGAATGWLTTSAPVVPGSEITLFFTLWDSYDSAFDSTVLLDDLRFSTEEHDATETVPSPPK